jgi:hypothetical protein
VASNRDSTSSSSSKGIKSPTDSPTISESQTQKSLSVSSPLTRSQICLDGCISSLPLQPPPSTSPPLAFYIAGFTSPVLKHAQQIAVLTSTTNSVEKEVNLFVENAYTKSQFLSSTPPSSRGFSRPVPPPPLVPITVTNLKKVSLRLSPANVLTPGKRISYTFDELRGPDEAAHFCLDVRNGTVMTYTVDMGLLLRLMGALTFVLYFFFFSCCGYFLCLILLVQMK